MDYDLGDDAGQLRSHLRELVANHIPADFLGACTENPQDLATTETFCKLLATEGCSRWRGRRSMAAAGVRFGSRRCCARRCGRNTSRAVRSTWGSTGSGRR